MVVHLETADLESSKLNDVVLNGEDLLDSSGNSEPHSENGDALHSAAKYLEDRNDCEDVNANCALNFTTILKKVI